MRPEETAEKDTEPDITEEEIMNIMLCDKLSPVEEQQIIESLKISTDQADENVIIKLLSDELTDQEIIVVTEIIEKSPAWQRATTRLAGDKKVGTLRDGERIRFQFAVSGGRP